MNFIVYNYYYDHQIDEKRRVMIPSQWRRKAEQEIYTMILWKKEVSPDEDLCLMMIPPLRMETIMKRLSDEKVGDSDAETLRMLLGCYSMQAELDKAGRIVIPKDFAEEAGLTDKAKLVGMMDMFAIWNPERFERVMAKRRERAPSAYGLI
ncbi:MAG: division/cell wall cluster transcriptional repressor MraZ [Verrucomicrobiia bacterium]|jgi:MraZ protein